MDAGLFPFPAHGRTCPAGGPRPASATFPASRPYAGAPDVPSPAGGLPEASAKPCSRNAESPPERACWLNVADASTTARCALLSRQGPLPMERRVSTSRAGPSCSSPDSGRRARQEREPVRRAIRTTRQTRRASIGADRRGLSARPCSCRQRRQALHGLQTALCRPFGMVPLCLFMHLPLAPSGAPRGSGRHAPAPADFDTMAGIRVPGPSSGTTGARPWRRYHPRPEGGKGGGRVNPSAPRGPDRGCIRSCHFPGKTGDAPLTAQRGRGGQATPAGTPEKGPRQAPGTVALRAGGPCYGRGTPVQAPPQLEHGSRSFSGACACYGAHTGSGALSSGGLKLRPAVEGAPVRPAWTPAP